MPKKIPLLEIKTRMKNLSFSHEIVFCQDEANPMESEIELKWKVCGGRFFPLTRAYLATKTFQNCCPAFQSISKSDENLLKPDIIPLIEEFDSKSGGMRPETQLIRWRSLFKAIKRLNKDYDLKFDYLRSLSQDSEENNWNSLSKQICENFLSGTEKIKKEDVENIFKNHQKALYG